MRQSCTESRLLPDDYVSHYWTRLAFCTGCATTAVHLRTQSRVKVAAIPELVSREWENREGPIVLATVSAEGTPNAIYASCVSKFGEDILLVADNFFFKTRANIEAGSPAS